MRLAAGGVGGKCGGRASWPAAGRGGAAHARGTWSDCCMPVEHLPLPRRLPTQLQPVMSRLPPAATPLVIPARQTAAENEQQSSPVSSLMSVDLPAPFAPSTATRLPRLTRQVTSVSCCLDAPGQVKETWPESREKRGGLGCGLLGVFRWCHAAPKLGEGDVHW